jgi:methylmalonyl-CoA/ethylmalonyl-CoA epimerase
VELMNKPKLDHIGIAVKSLDAAKVYETLGLTIDHVETVETQKVKTAFLSAGDSQLELLEPTGPDSTVAKFIEKRGEGIHHICLRVDDIEAHLENLKAQGYRLINEAPVPGAHGCRVAFLHPAAGNGVLIELSELIE